MRLDILVFAESDTVLTLARGLVSQLARDDIFVNLTESQEFKYSGDDPYDLALVEYLPAKDKLYPLLGTLHGRRAVKPAIVLHTSTQSVPRQDILAAGATDCWDIAVATKEQLLEQIFAPALVHQAEPRHSPNGASRQSLKYFSTLLSDFPNGAVSFLDRDLRFLLAEGKGTNDLGFDHTDLVGKTFDEIDSGDSSFLQLKHLCEAALQGESGSTDIEYKGKYRSVYGVPVREDDGSVFGVILVSQDTSQWRRAEAELNLSRNRLGGIVNSAMDAIITIDESHSIQLFNRAAERMFGYEMQQVVGGPLDNLIPVRFRPGHDRHITSFGTTGQTERRMGALGAVSGLRSNGEEFPIEASISQVQLEGQKLYTVILRDISARHEAEQALARSRADLEAANDSLEHRVQERTEALAAAIQGLRASEARLMHANQTFTALTELRVTSREEVAQALERITEEGSVIMDVERCGIWIYNADRSALDCLDRYDRGQQRHFRQGTILPANRPEYFGESLTGPAIFMRPPSKQPIEGELPTSALVARVTIGGECIGVLKSEHGGAERHWKAEEETFAGTLAALCSLTFEAYERTSAESALRRAKEEAEKARDEAQEANTAKSEFLSRMSHELRTPLNSILGFAQVMEMQTTLDAKQSVRVNHILRAGRHLLRLVDEVLDIARVESGKLALSPEPVDLKITVEMALDLLRPLCNENALFVQFDAESCRNLFVKADQQRLSQVLLNLLSNAAKYNRPGGQVSVSALPDGENIIVQVRDTGTGIAPEKLGKLFQPFERLGAESGPVQGTGLGLALSHRLIEAMEGTMGVRSTPGEGSTFWFALPRTEPVSAAIHAVEPPSKPPAISGKHTLLYIEDNLTNLQVIQDILEDNHEVTLISAMQGQIGLDLARRHRPSLILLDLHLPDISGEEVLRQLKSDDVTADIPVLIVTADATPKLGSRLKRAGATEYLSKPLDVRQFLEVTRNILLSNDQP